MVPPAEFKADIQAMRRFVGHPVRQRGQGLRIRHGCRDRRCCESRANRWPAEFILPNTGLERDCPRFYLLPPSGGDGRRLLQPQIRLPYGPRRPERAIQAILSRSR